jgi:hypothetical protein
MLSTSIPCRNIAYKHLDLSSSKDFITHLALEINLRAMRQRYIRLLLISQQLVYLFWYDKITENISGLASAKRFKAS